MPIPTSIKVGPFVYSVDLSSRAIAGARMDNAGLTAQADHIKQSVTVDPDMAETGIAESLLHEVLHAVHRTVGINAQDKLRAHDLIYRTCPTLLLILRDNPDLVAFLTETT